MGPERRALRGRSEMRDPLGSETDALGERNPLARALGDPLKEVRLGCSCRAGTQQHRVLARKDLVGFLESGVAECGLSCLAGRQPRIRIQRDESALPSEPRGGVLNSLRNSDRLSKRGAPRHNWPTRSMPFREPNEWGTIQKDPEWFAINL